MGIACFCSTVFLASAEMTVGMAGKDFHLRGTRIILRGCFTHMPASGGGADLKAGSAWGPTGTAHMAFSVAWGLDSEREHLKSDCAERPKQKLHGLS